MARALIERWWIIILIPVIFGVLAVTYVLVRPATFQATATLDVVNLRLLPGGGAGVFLPQAQALPTFLDTQQQIIGSTSIIIAAIETLEGTPADHESDNVKAVSDIEKLESFGKRLIVSRIGQSNLINISFRSDDPQTSANAVNAVVDAYLAKLEQDRLETAEAASGWLQERLRGVGPRATVVSAAYPPIHKSDTRGVHIIAIVGVISGFIGLFVALILSFFDTRIRNPEELVRVVGQPCLGVDKSKPRTKIKAGASDTLQDLQVPSAKTEFDNSALFNVASLIQSSTSESGSRMRYVGVTSLQQKNSNAFVSEQLARLISTPDHKVLLVDANPYKLSASANNGIPDGERGLIDILMGDGELSENHMKKEPDTGLSIISVGTVKNSQQAGQLIWSDKLRELKPSFRQYDLVIFILPPLFASTDVGAASKYLDSIIFVAEWGKTSQSDLATALELNPTIHKKIIGSVLINAKENPLIFLFSPVASFLRKQRTFLSSAAN
ncbi:Wzz/FepE/Etk N-terminal domain-containing protein [Roseibium sp.]|uniref:Wzz/FepE/Etk N-terminal domain-containing protein n=1 Tax=Roseibium sp. TaxID=1936156 RepID=UPI003B5153A9